jgi:hypothetical protein
MGMFLYVTREVVSNSRIAAWAPVLERERKDDHDRMSERQPARSLACVDVSAHEEIHVLVAVA